MPDAARNAIHLAVFVGAYALIFGIAAIVERSKRDSPRWRQRSDRQRRLLARLPGVAVALGLYAVVLFLLPV